MTPEAMADYCQDDEYTIEDVYQTSRLEAMADYCQDDEYTIEDVYQTSRLKAKSRKSKAESRAHQAPSIKRRSKYEHILSQRLLREKSRSAARLARRTVKECARTGTLDEQALLASKWRVE